MRTQLRLNSVVLHGVGSGPESGAIDLIYSFLLKELEQAVYTYISINQIGNDLNEFIMKQPRNQIYCNIRYPVYEDFETKTVDEKNRIRLDVIHTALLRIAEYDKKLDIIQLHMLRKKILDNNFSFDFVCELYPNKKISDLIAKIIVHPEIDRFNYYVVIEENKIIKCKQLIYNGLTNLVYFTGLFSMGKWRNESEFIITGKLNQIEIHVLVNGCRIEFKNLTAYDKPPYFEMMRADISNENRDKAYEDWLHSLPPAHAAIIRQSHN